jgi:hypothetical protein
MGSNVKKGEGSTSVPGVYKTGDIGMSVGDESSIARDRKMASGKAKPRFPHSPLTIVPGGSANTGSGGPAHKGSYGSGTPNA